MAAPTLSNVLDDAYKRVQANPPGLLWLVLLWVVMSAAFNVGASEHFGSDAGYATMVIASVAMIILSWLMTRKLAFARPDEQGGVMFWFIWGAVATLPGLIPLLILAGSAPGEAYSVVKDVVLTASALSLLFPLWVHSTGMAIDAYRTSVRQTLTFWFKAWPVFLVVTFTVAAIDAGVTAVLVPVEIRPFATFEMMWRALAAAIVNALATVAMLAILVSAWRAMVPTEVANIAPDDQLG